MVCCPAAWVKPQPRGARTGSVPGRPAAGWRLQRAGRGDRIGRRFSHEGDHENHPRGNVGKFVSLHGPKGAA
ncbi:hypothetical protein M8756_05910 [Lutimaribacter sp. EGI FJ00015]|nr:hypothetical protein [Lutimaribacter sp. EGI FJ00015]